MLDDLDFADDFTLLSHTHRHLQEKTNQFNSFAQKVGLQSSRIKTKVMTLNVNNPSPVTVEGEDLPTTDSITYLGNVVRQNGGAGSDIQSRLKARNVFCSMNSVWRLPQHTLRWSYQSGILSTLLYSSECWRMTNSDLNKLSTFHTKSLRRILGIFWPRTISNYKLLTRCGQESMDTILMRRHWSQVIRSENSTIKKTALH